MKRTSIATLLVISCSGVYAADKQNLIDPTLTEVWEPIPAEVNSRPVPSDAIVLFDGNSLSHWQHKKDVPAKWSINGNYMTVKPKTGAITTKDNFCDIQLHVEFKTPAVIEGKNGQQSGNSGIFLQERYEVQVLNSYKNRTYSNGQAGSIYKQTPPLVNASLPPETWQTYDIIYKAPLFSADGNVKSKANVTVLHNGVLIQNHTEIQGGTTYRGEATYAKAHGCAPIVLQDHNDEVSYRNIWVRKI